MSGAKERRFGRRSFTGGLVAAALGLLIVSPVAEAHQGGSSGPVDTQKQLAQGITVRGDGEAEAPADSAIMQFIVRVDPAQAVANANAGLAEGPAGVSVTEDQMLPLVEGAKAKGIDDKSIDYFVVPEGSFTSVFGPGVGILIVQIDKAELKHRVKIADAVMNAAKRGGLLFDQIGIAFAVDDCEALDLAALVDARERAENQATLVAEAMGLSLGELIAVEKQPSYSGYSGAIADACAHTPTMETAREQYFPGFDRNADAVREIYETILVTYAIG